jgi:hypothetical protein
VLCVECKTDPLTPGHYCECCGRTLSREERGELIASAPSGSDVPALQNESGPAGRCESCGVPSPNGGLCLSCQQAFGPLLDKTRPPADLESSKTAPVRSVETIEQPIETVVHTQTGAQANEDVKASKTGRSRPERLPRAS